MSTDELSLNEEQLAKDAREFGLLIADAVQSEVEGEGSEERLQAMQSTFLQAIDHVEKRYGAESALMWQDEANRAIQQRFAALAPSQEGPQGGETPPADQEPSSGTSSPKGKSRKKG